MNKDYFSSEPFEFDQEFDFEQDEFGFALEGEQWEMDGEAGFGNTPRMNISELQNYEQWIGKSPVAIRKAVIAVGGWANVFPMSIAVKSAKKIELVFPKWASRVRNYFNVTPVTLERLPKGDARIAPIKNRLGYSIRISQIFQKHAFALNGDVYADEHGRAWYEMDKVGAVYHTPGKVNRWKLIVAYMAKYSQFPIFKLISPDDTGGSLELCVFNRKRAKTFGEIGEVVQVSPWLVRDEVLRGSYNYAETVVRGDQEHDYRDVQPHNEGTGFYVNPPIYSSIADRRFPVLKPWFDKGLEPFKFDTTTGSDAPGKVTTTDAFAELMARRYPPNHPGSSERVRMLEQMFRGMRWPKKLLARIESRNAND